MAVGVASVASYDGVLSDNSYAKVVHATTAVSLGEEIAKVNAALHQRVANALKDPNDRTMRAIIGLYAQQTSSQQQLVALFVYEKRVKEDLERVQKEIDYAGNQVEVAATNAKTSGDAAPLVNKQPLIDAMAIVDSLSERMQKLSEELNQVQQKRQTAVQAFKSSHAEQRKVVSDGLAAMKTGDAAVDNVIEEQLDMIAQQEAREKVVEAAIEAAGGANVPAAPDVTLAAQAAMGQGASREAMALRSGLMAELTQVMAMRAVNTTINPGDTVRLDQMTALRTTMIGSKERAASKLRNVEKDCDKRQADISTELQGASAELLEAKAKVQRVERQLGVQPRQHGPAPSSAPRPD